MAPIGVVIVIIKPASNLRYSLSLEIFSVLFDADIGVCVSLEPSATRLGVFSFSFSSKDLPMVKPKERDAFTCPDNYNTVGPHVREDINELSSVSTNALLFPGERTYALDVAIHLLSS